MNAFVLATSGIAVMSLLVAIVAFMMAEGNRGIRLAVGSGFLVLALLLAVVGVLAMAVGERTGDEINIRQSFKHSDIDAVLGSGNWVCFPDRTDGVAIKSVPANFVVRYPISNVDKGAKYFVGEVVPAGGSATAWLQGFIPAVECR